MLPDSVRNAFKMYEPGAHRVHQKMLNPARHQICQASSQLTAHSWYQMLTRGGQKTAGHTEKDIDS